MAWRRFLVVLAVAGPILAILAYGFTRDPREIPSPLISKPASSFTLTLFDGRRLSLEDLRGKVVFLNFWASWCPPCRTEARILEAAWQKYKDQDVVFLGIDIQDTEQAALAFLREFGITYPNGRDALGKIAIDYGVWGIPETFIIDKEGRITYKHAGAIGWQTVMTKIDEARRGIASAREGKGEVQSIR